MLPPQPSPMAPQYCPPIDLHGSGTQAGSRQTLGSTPGPPQVPAFGQTPQSRDPPQPSPIIPQYLPPTKAQVSGMQPGAMQTPLWQSMRSSHAGQISAR